MGLPWPVLLIEDETLIRMTIADLLIELGDAVAEAAGNCPMGWPWLKALDATVATLDLDRQDMRGPSLRSELG